MQRIIQIGICIFTIFFPISALADVPPNISAWSRGGTILIKFDAAYINQQNTNAEQWNGWGYSFHGEDGINQELFSLLTTSTKDSLWEEYFANGNAELQIKRPFLCGDDEYSQMCSETNDDIIMNQRLVSDAWYVLLRPANGFSNEYSLRYHVLSVQLSMKDSKLDDTKHKLHTQPLEYTHCQSIDLYLQKTERSQLPFHYSYDGLEVEVFPIEDVYIAVIKEQSATKEMVSCARIYIGSEQNGMEVLGYLDHSKGVYCCVLNEAEFNALESGSNVYIDHNTSLAEEPWPF